MGKVTPKPTVKAPPKRVNLLEEARKKARAKGTTIDRVVGDVFWALYQSAKQGDVKAAQLLLDRLTDDAPRTDVNIIAGSVAIGGGPPLPDGEELADFLDDLRAGTIQEAVRQKPRIEAEVGENPEDDLL